MIAQEILKVDTGLMNASNATYQMVDQYDAVYDPVMYKPLNEGRQLVYFVVPKGQPLQDDYCDSCRRKADQRQLVGHTQSEQ